MQLLNACNDLRKAWGKEKYSPRLKEQQSILATVEACHLLVSHSSKYGPPSVSEERCQHSFDCALSVNFWQLLFGSEQTNKWIAH